MGDLGGERRICELTPVDHRAGLQRVPMLVDLQAETVGDPRIARVAFVAQREAFPADRNVDPVPLPSSRLDLPYFEVVLDDRVRVLLLRRAIEAVDLLAKHPAAQRADALA